MLRSIESNSFPRHVTSPIGHRSTCSWPYLLANYFVRFAFTYRVNDAFSTHLKLSSALQQQQQLLNERANIDSEGKIRSTAPGLRCIRWCDATKAVIRHHKRLRTYLSIAGCFTKSIDSTVRCVRHSLALDPKINLPYFFLLSFRFPLFYSNSVCRNYFPLSLFRCRSLEIMRFIGASE